MRFDVDKAVRDMEVLKAQMDAVKSSRKYQQLIIGKLKKTEERKPLFQLEGDYAYFQVINPERAAKSKTRVNPYKEALLESIKFVINEMEPKSTGKDKWLVNKDNKNVEISLVAHRTPQSASGAGSFGTGKTLNSQLSKAVYEELKTLPDINIIEANSNKIMIETDKNPISIKFTSKR